MGRSARGREEVVWAGFYEGTTRLHHQDEELDGVQRNPRKISAVRSHSPYISRQRLQCLHDALAVERQLPTPPADLMP